MRHDDTVTKPLPGDAASQPAAGTGQACTSCGASAPADCEQIVSIMDSMNAVVYVADIDTHELLFLNPYAASIFGSDWAGRPCYEVLQSGQHGRCPFCTNDRLVVGGSPGPAVVWEFQNTVTGKWFHCIDKAIPWRDGRLVRMEIAVDVSDRKEAEHFHDEYVDLISHDLRNPLNAVVLRAEVMQQSLRMKGLAQEAAALGPLLAAARRAEALLADLFETTRLHAGHLELQREPVDLGELVGRAIARVASPSDRARIELQPDLDGVRVDADPPRLDRVIDNLLENALKYSQDRPVRVLVAQRGAEGVVSVIDQGVGIPVAELPHLFQRHYRATTAGAAKGLGLGLYAARLIIEAHGGRIWAQSEPGQGSAFHFALQTVNAP
jgi:nitrogen-specific signal transduction histidine kinase